MCLNLKHAHRGLGVLFIRLKQAIALNNAEHIKVLEERIKQKKQILLNHFDNAELASKIRKDLNELEIELKQLKNE